MAMKVLHFVMIFLLVYSNAVAQVIPRVFQFDYAVHNDGATIAFLNTKEKILGIKLGPVYRIYCLQDSLAYEPSYPRHTKTLLVYHINDYNRLLKIDTARKYFDTWKDLKVAKQDGKNTLHKYELPLDSGKFHRNEPTSLFVWVKYASQQKSSWVLQLLRLFRVLNGIPENAEIVSFNYGSIIVNIKDLEFLKEQLKFQDTGMYTTIEQLERESGIKRTRN
jgi:hypothetical protein